MNVFQHRLNVYVPDELFDALVASVLERINGQRQFLSKRALAIHYGVPERTIKTWRANGLPGRKVGREVMFCVDETDRWIDGEGRPRAVAGRDA